MKKISIIIAVLLLSACSKNSDLRISGLPERFILHDKIDSAVYFSTPESITLHFEGDHFDKLAGFDPEYRYSVDLEIGHDKLQKSKLYADEIKGSLVWGKPNSVYNKQSCQLESGKIKLSKVDVKDKFIAYLDVYFRDKATNDLIRIFGKVRANKTTKEKVAADKAELNEDVKKRAANLNDKAWNPEEFKKVQKY